MRIRSLSLPVLLSLSMAFAATGAAAADLRVRLVDSTGRPVDAAAVLVNVGAEVRAAAPPSIEIRQKNLRFAPSLSVVPVGTSVSFTNEDEFDHHVRGTGDGTNFEFMIPAASESAAKPKTSARGKRATAVLRHPGIVRLSCHLHGSMRGHILVADTPHHGLTDETGAISFTGLPEGQAAVSAWHPLMLTRAPATVVRLAEQPTEVTLRLAFVVPNPKR
jgi:plastocyanin